MKLEAKRQQAQAMASFPPLPDALLYLIRQDTVRMAEADEPNHNSSWDYAISPDGHHYFSACAESLDTYYLRLYEYLPDTNECKRILGLEDVAVTYPRAIRASKIHSSLSFLPDGKILFATHTTAAAPGHPRWMPFAYYDHPWEGFPGSNVLLYDPITGKTEDLGIPVPRESIYGGQYEATTHSFYFFGYHRGHAYRFDLATRRVTDFGQATEFGTWRTIPGADGNLYGTTASGRLIRINIAKQCIEDVPYNFPFHAELINRGTNNKLMHYANHPDGGLYFTALSCKNILRYDYQTKAVETLVRLVPPEVDAQNMDGRCMGMAIDAYGVLWYLCEVLGLGALLCAWDPHGDATPRSYGLLGTRDRVFRASFGCFIRDDVLYANDTNRANTAHPAVLQVRLADLRTHDGEKTDLPRDPLFYLSMKDGFDRYLALTGRILTDDIGEELQTRAAITCKRDSEAFRRTLPAHFDEKQRRRFYGDNALNATHLPYTSCWAAKLWQEEGLYESTVCDVAFDAENNVTAVVRRRDGICERVTLHSGAVVDRTVTAWTEPDPEVLADKYRDIALPCRPERNHLAYASAECTLAGGIRLVGTRDSMLALVHPDGTVFSLGAVGPCGAVHAFAVSPDGQSAIGVSGDPDDLGVVFRFDLKTGLKLYGRIFFHHADMPGLIGASNEPHTVAWSADGKSVAIGVRDRLACVYRFVLA